MMTSTSRMRQTRSRLFVAVFSLFPLLMEGCAAIPSDDDRAVGADAMRRVGLRDNLLESPDVSREWVRERLRSTITEDDAVRIALLNNPRVVAQFARLGVERSRMIQAGLMKNPVFSGNSKSFSIGTETEFALAQPFLDIFTQATRVAAADAEFGAAKAEVILEIVHLTFDVRRAIVELEIAHQDARLVRSALEVAEAATHIQRQLHAAGNVKDQLVTIDEVTEAELRMELATAESREVRHREKLNVLLGAWGVDTTWTLNANLGQPRPVGDTAIIEQRAIEKSLDLFAMRASINASAQNAGIVGWERFFGDPAVGLNMKREPTGETGFGPAFGIEVPVFDTGRNRQAGADARVREQLALYMGLAVDIRAAARTLREAVAASAERSVYARTVLVPLRARLTRETLRDFNAMQVGVFDVLVARRGELEAERQALAALGESSLAALDLLELVTGRFDRSVFDKGSDDLTKSVLQQTPNRRTP